MPKSIIQNELTGEIGQAFNLVSEYGEDPERIIRERQEAEAAAAAALEYESKMQRSFAQCPGFIGCDPPSGERSKGRVVVDPTYAFQAREWLKRRFNCNEAIELSDHGLCIEVMPRVRAKPGQPRRRVSFLKPEQFDLAL